MYRTVQVRQLINFRLHEILYGHACFALPYRVGRNCFASPVPAGHCGQVSTSPAPRARNAAGGNASPFLASRCLYCKFHRLAGCGGSSHPAAAHLRSFFSGVRPVSSIMRRRVESIVPRGAWRFFLLHLFTVRTHVFRTGLHLPLHTCFAITYENLLVGGLVG